MHTQLGNESGAIVFAALVSSLLVLVNAPVIGERLGIMDHPDEFRKKHAQVTPLVGGLAIMIPVVLWCSVVLYGGISDDIRLIQVILLCGAGATLVGYADDQSSTSPSSRLLSLFLLSTIALVIDPGLVPVSLNWGSFSPLILPTWFAYIFIAVAMAGYVNAVNMADGQNGIVSGMFIIWAGCLILVTGGLTQSASEVLFTTALLTFVFNMAGRVFLGDSGTYGATFVFGLLAIRAHNHWGVTAETITVWFLIPILDCVRLMVARMLQGQVPSDGDRTHLHHRLQDRVGKTYGLIIYLGVVGISSLVASLRPHLSLVCMIALAAFYFSFAWLAAAENAEGEELPESGPEKAVRLVGNSNVVILETKDSDRS